MTERPRYHHGDLRNALEKAGLDIIEEDGLAALTLRAIAARAGVSHAAPAHHFGNLRGLLTALVTTGFIRFAASMADARAEAAADPLEQMRAAGFGYIAFARRHRALFRLMFSSADLDVGNPDFQQASGAAYRQLQEIAGPAADALGATTEAQRREVAHLAWTSIHGYAHLLVEGYMNVPGEAEPLPPPDIAALLFGRFGASAALPPAAKA